MQPYRTHSCHNQAQYDCVKALPESEFFDDFKSIDVPVLVIHGTDDQICPCESPTTNPEQINYDLLTFFKETAAVAA